MTGPTIEANEAVLNIVRRVLDQHQAIIDANTKLLEVLGYPVVVVRPVEDFRKGVS